MCSLNHDPPLFLPPMVNLESAVVWLLPFHTWLHKTCGRLLPGRCPCLCVHAWLWWNIEVFYYRPSVRCQRNSCPLILFFLPSFISVAWLYFIRHGVQIRKANLIWSHDRANPSQLQNEKAVWSESIPKASMGSFSQMLVPFAALTVLEYDEKGLGSVQWLSYVYEKKNSGRERHSAVDGEMKWPIPVFVCKCVCNVNWMVNT